MTIEAGQTLLHYRLVEKIGEGGAAVGRRRRQASVGEQLRARSDRKPPASLDSYDCVLRTYEYLHIHYPPEHLKARDCLEGAVEIDPDYAEGRAWLAYLYSEEYHHRRNERPEYYDSQDRALEAAERAIRLDPENQVSQGALGLGLLGSYLSQHGDFDRGVPMVRRALELNPNPQPWLRMSLYLEHYHDGRYEAALAEAQITDTADYRTPMFLAAAYGQLGRPDEAMRALADLRASWPGSADEMRQELIQRNGYVPGLAEHVMDGLRKAGLEDGS